MRVGLFTGRPLGWKISQLVRATSNVVASQHIADGWWGTAGEPSSDYVIGSHPDLIISVLTAHIFGAAELAQATRIVNLHLAPLPGYRGCNPFAHAIINNEARYGCTLHYVNQAIDTGPIIELREVPLYKSDTGASLHARAEWIAYELFTDHWDKLRDGVFPVGRPQTGTTRYHRRDSLEKYMTLADWPAEQHERIRRALTFPPFPMPT